LKPEARIATIRAGRNALEVLSNPYRTLAGVRDSCQTSGAVETSTAGKKCGQQNNYPFIA
jgi:hypothetical protein